MQWVTVLVFVTSLLCVHQAQAGAPITPPVFYAIKGSNVQLPCLVEDPTFSLAGTVWRFEHGSTDLRVRARSQPDGEDASLTLLTIRDVKAQDAGNFSCSTIDGTSYTQLEVIEMSEPRVIRLRSVKPTEVTLSWSAPLSSPQKVRGYNIYVSELSGKRREATFRTEGVSSNQKETFVLEEMVPGGKYQIKLSANYPTGDQEQGELVEGPKSAGSNITFPELPAGDIKAVDVKAEPWLNSTIQITWKLSVAPRPKSLIGFKVSYKGLGKKGKTQTGEITVKKSADGGRSWRTVIKKLRPRVKYQIQVRPILKTGEGNASAPIVFKHDGFGPELSVKATALGPDTVLVSYRVLGHAKLSKLRVLYSDSSAIKWRRIKNLNTKDQYAILSGLQPRSVYYFIAKARLGRKNKDVVTHVMTPPSGLSSPTNISVTPKDSNSIEVTWQHDRPMGVKGYRTTVEEMLPDDSYRVFKEATSPTGQLKAVIEGLAENKQYRVKVTPFDLNGPGEPNEPVLFRISPAGTEQKKPDNPTAPVISPMLEPLIKIAAGETLELVCSATGNPVPSVRWFADGIPLGAPAEGRGVLVIEGIDASSTIVCRADNDVDVAVASTRVEVVQPQGAASAPVTFTTGLPGMLVVDLGSDITQVCSAEGGQKPTVRWYKNGALVPESTFAEASTFYEENIQEGFKIKCEAYTTTEKITKEIQVFLKEDLSEPIYFGKAEPVIVSEGEAVNLPCIFTGSPNPKVTWFENDTMIGQSLPGRNNLTLPSVTRSMQLVCRGENVAGIAEQIIHVQLKEPDANNEPIQVVAYIVAKSERQVELKWFVERGDLASIRTFTVLMYDNNDKIVMRHTVLSDQRDLLVGTLTPNSRYRLILQTLTHSGVVDEEILRFVTQKPNLPIDSSDQDLHVDVMEIREDQARVNIMFTGATNVRYYRLRVKDTQARRGASPLINQRVRPRFPSVKLLRLQPERSYEVIVDAFPVGSRRPMATSSLKFSTASLASSVPSVLSNLTSNLIDVAYKEFEDEIEKEELEHSLTLTALEITPYELHLGWSVDTGSLALVDSFILMLRKEGGGKMLEQEISGNTRSISISSLEPSNNYTAYIRARGDQGQLLAEAEFNVTTKSTEDTQGGKSKPLLDLVANEIRGSRVRLHWTVRGVKASTITGFRLKVQDSDANGYEMLNRNISPEATTIVLEQIPSLMRYYVTLDAIAYKNTPILRTTLTFETPGPEGYGKTVIGTAQEIDTPIATVAPTLHAGVTDASEATDTALTQVSGNELTIILEKQSSSSTKVKWEMEDTVSKLVARLKITVKSEGPEGRALLRKAMSLQSSDFQITGLISSSYYYIQMEALSADGEVLLTAGTVYNPGRSPPLTRIRSRPDEAAVTSPWPPPAQTDARTRSPITTTEPPVTRRLNAVERFIHTVSTTTATATISWHNFSTRDAITMVRFTVMENGQSRGFRLQYVPPGINSVTITGLRPATTYGFQAAAVPSDRQPVQWSDMYYRDTLGR